MKLILPAAALLFALSNSRADVQPEDQTGSGEAINTPLRNAPRIYQAYYPASQFSSVTTTQILTGLQFQLSSGFTSGVGAGDTWPSQDLDFSDYTIQLSAASGQLAAEGSYLSPTTTAFTYGQGANLTTVRTGGLTVPADSFTNLGTQQPNDFGVTILFSVPYTFTPGDSLVLTLSHLGYIPSEELNPFFAASNVPDTVNRAIFSTEAGSAGNAMGQTLPLVVNFVSQPIPEPGSAALVMMGALSVLAGRSRRRRN